MKIVVDKPFTWWHAGVRRVEYQPGAPYVEVDEECAGYALAVGRGHEYKPMEIETAEPAAELETAVIPVKRKRGR